MASASPRAPGTILETPRLALRELTVDDLDFVADMLGDDVVMRFYPKRLDRAESLEWIERQRMRYDRDGHGLWLVTNRVTGEPLGQVGLVTHDVARLPEPRHPEIGYLLHHRFWHRGFASEAAAAVRDRAFDVYGYRRVISLIRPENEPSQAVARRIGMTPIGETDYVGMRHLIFSMAPEEARGD